MMKRNRGILWMVLGIVCLAAALFLIMRNRQEEEIGAAAAERAQVILEQEVIPDLFGISETYESTATTMQTVEIDGQLYIGVVEIPSLELTLPVMENWDEELLKISPCRYEGSFLDDTLIIAGHNYRKHFSGIKQMEKGDMVIFTDVNGVRYNYEVDGIEYIEGTDVEAMVEGDWDLTLFTCNYGGQKRVTVRCRRVAR